ncbi:MAG: DMT family transporter [Deferrisomatales bacterium]|nr:DMT family transporter [Deferrisomatales bacterium]
MTPSLLLLLLMFGVGALSALQPSVNARLADRVAGVLPAATVSFAVGTVALLAVALATGRGGGLRGVGSAPWWELSGGLIGAVYVASTILVFPRIGTAAGMAAVISAQLATGLLLDRAGAFGFRQIDLDWRRVVGVLLLLAGAALIYRR